MTDTIAPASADAAPPDAQRMFGPWRRELRLFVELFALCGIAFVQPLLDILGKNASLFVTRGTTAVEAILLVLVVALVPATLAWLLTVAIGVLATPFRRYGHAAVAGALIAVIAIEAVKERTSFDTAALLAVGVVLGTLGGAALFRSEAVRRFVRYLAVAVPVFGLVFLVASPVTDVVFSSDPASATGVGIESPHRVVMVVMDELPIGSLLDEPGEIDPELYPNLAAFAGEATWYRNNSTVASYTQRALPALVTGQYPSEEDALPTAVDYPENLFTLLGEGYTVNAHELITSLCPSDVCQARGSGLAGLLGDSWDLWKEFARPERRDDTPSVNAARAFPETGVAPARRFTRSLRARDGATFDFLHLELPHNPWHILPTMQDSEATADEIRGASVLKWSSAPAAVQARQRHLLQTQAADVLFGEIVAKLRKIDAYDDAMIVVTADHGVSFTEGEPLRHVSDGNYHEIMWTPLFVKYPGQAAGEVDDRPALSVDVMPTIAEVVGAEVPWEVDGRSLRGEPRAEGPRPLYQWDVDGIAPNGVMQLPEGADHFAFDGAAGFDRALAVHGAAAGPDPLLRIYRDQPFGDLVGREVSELPVGDAGDATGAIDDRALFANVDPLARSVPWAYVEGFGNQFAAASNVALAANGRIVAVSYAELLNDEGDTFFTFNLPPHLMTTGRNDMQLFVVSGSDDAPRLDEVELQE